MIKKLFQAPKGKQVRLKADTMGYSMIFSHEVPLEENTGIKPLADHARGIEVLVLDGPHPGLHLIAARTTDVE